VVAETLKKKREGYGPRDARLAADSLARAMEMAHGSGVGAAAILGVPLRTVRRWLARHGMSNGHSIHGGSNGHGNGAAKGGHSNGHREALR